MRGEERFSLELSMNPFLKGRVFPEKGSFVREAESGLIPPIYAEIPLPEARLDPADCFGRVYSGPGGVLLHSAKGPSNIARYSFIGIEPYASVRIKAGEVEIEAGGRRAVSSKEKPLDRLREFINIYRQKPVPGLPPFQGGLMGLFCYEFVHYFEKLPRKAVDTLNLPDAAFYLYDRVIAFDHLEKKAWIIVCPGARDTGLGYGDISGLDWGRKYDETESLLRGILEGLQKAPADLRLDGNLPNIYRKISPRPSFPKRGNPSLWKREVGRDFLMLDSPAPQISITHEMTKKRYMEIVRRAKEYIAAGDIFQANLSLRVKAEIGGAHPWKIYSLLKEINPSPFACYMDFGDFQIASSSPERLIRVRGGVVDTRPIAGTRPRGRDRAGDEEMRAELLLNAKEKAEHIMLIDLERNDIGKVCDYGSVEVDELMVTEDYSHVMHIVSNIHGRLARGHDMFSAVRAAFPGGTITGVPKVRCMEIIDELEPVSRGPYTGSAGYFGFSGNMDLNIIIRTFLIKDKAAYVQAGAGIVADSDPEREYYESLKKAQALMETLRKLGK